jgi:outer membrane scaffolding protein for murein synthesis (MipA/OmpV family)
MRQSAQRVSRPAARLGGVLAALLALGVAWPAAARAADADDAAPEEDAGNHAATAADAFDLALAVQQDTPPARRQGGPPEGVPSVFDDNWINIGIGAGLIPTYAGSDDYFIFPLPLVTGRLGGVGFRPSGAGMNFDLLSPQPTVVQQSKAPQFSLGPTFRFRVERGVDPRDPVVEAAGRLDTALEVGVNAGVTFPAVLNPNDALTIGTAIRWDVLGAHRGQVIEPTVAYLTPLGLGVLVQLSAALEIVDDDFARYYQSVTPAQSAASGLPVFNARGGANRLATAAIVAVDLDGNALNGGFNIFALGAYARMLGDGANTPFTRLRGTGDQFQIGLGVGYTF